MVRRVTTADLTMLLQAVNIIPDLVRRRADFFLRADAVTFNRLDVTFLLIINTATYQYLRTENVTAKMLHSSHPTSAHKLPRVSCYFKL